LQFKRLPFSDELIKPVICTTIRRKEAGQERLVGVHDALGSGTTSENELIF